MPHFRAAFLRKRRKGNQKVKSQKSLEFSRKERCRGRFCNLNPQGWRCRSINHGLMAVRERPSSCGAVFVLPHFSDLYHMLRLFLYIFSIGDSYSHTFLVYLRCKTGKETAGHGAKEKPVCSDSRQSAPEGAGGTGKGGKTPERVHHGGIDRILRV